MITINLRETSAEEIKAIMELRKMGVTDEQIQARYNIFHMKPMPAPAVTEKTSKCENCIHENVCSFYFGLTKETVADNLNCIFYKDKSLFVELLCKVGTTLYFLYNRPHADKPDLTPKIYETNKWYFDVDEKGISILPRDIHGYNGEYHYYLGKTVFLTSEEAERARGKEK